MTSKNTICLWYARDALEAATFYAKTFPTAPCWLSTMRPAIILLASRAMC